MLIKNLSRHWYDRNAVPRSFFYSASAVAPHADVQRWLYTCPSGKKAIVESGDVGLVRQTAAAPVGFVSAYLSLTTVVNATQAYTPRIDLLSNNVADRAQSALSLQAVLVAGDTLEGRTRDLGTGGTVAYFVSGKITEFDA